MAHGAEPGADPGCASKTYSNMGWYPCRNKGKVEEGGKLWCRTHAPSIVAERRRERNAKWDAKWKAQAEHRRQRRAEADEQERRAECYPALLAALKVIARISHLDDYTSTSKARLDIQHTAENAIEAAEK